MVACYYLEVEGHGMTQTGMREMTKQKWSLRVLGLPNRSICNILACKYLYPLNLLIQYFISYCVSLILSSFQYVLFNSRQQKFLCLHHWRIQSIRSIDPSIVAICNTIQSWRFQQGSPRSEHREKSPRMLWILQSERSLCASCSWRINFNPGGSM